MNNYEIEVRNGTISKDAKVLMFRCKIQCEPYELAVVCEGLKAKYGPKMIYLVEEVIECKKHRKVKAQEIESQNMKLLQSGL